MHSHVRGIYKKSWLAHTKRNRFTKWKGRGGEEKIAIVKNNKYIHF